jgi:hypothetical protein
MFHDGGALSPSLLRIAFTAAAVVQSQEEQPSLTELCRVERDTCVHTFNRISLGRLLSLRSRHPRTRKQQQQQEQQHRGEGDTAMEETAAAQPGLHLSLPGCPELARPLWPSLPAHSAVPFGFL